MSGQPWELNVAMLVIALVFFLRNIHEYAVVYRLEQKVKGRIQRFAMLYQGVREMNEDLVFQARQNGEIKVTEGTGEAEYGDYLRKERTRREKR